MVNVFCCMIYCFSSLSSIVQDYHITTAPQTEKIFISIAGEQSFCFKGFLLNLIRRDANLNNFFGKTHSYIPTNFDTVENL